MESVILSVRLALRVIQIKMPTNRKVTLAPAGRSGTQVNAGPWILSPMKAIAGAGTSVFINENLPVRY